MTVSERLKRLEEEYEPLREHVRLNPHFGDMLWVLARVKKLTLALEKIKNSAHGIYCDLHADEIARKALDDET